MNFDSLHFVGRQAELTQWAEFLADPRGLAVLVVGAEGTGKTALLDQIALQAWHKTSLRCGYVRYDVCPEDSPESVLRYMLEDAFSLARASAGAIDNPGLRFWQWDAFFDGLGIPHRRMDDVHRLVNLLRFDPQKHIGEQFVGRLQKIAQLMGPKGRAIFLVDHTDSFCEEFVEPWKRIVSNLPPGVKFVFTQTPEDAFLKAPEFLALPQVKTIPSPPQSGLGPLSEHDFDKLLSQFKFAPEQGDMKRLYFRYGGNPYLVRAAFDLLQIHPKFSLDSFPEEPDQQKLARMQWEQLVKLGPEVVRLFRAYAFLDVTVPDEIVMQVACINIPTFKRILDIPSVRNFIRSCSEGHQIADRPLQRCIAEDPRTESPFLSPYDYHRRAITAYESMIQRNLRPDAFSAARLPEHALAIGGPYAFARSVGEMVDHLLLLCHFDTALRLINRALAKIDPHDKEAGQLRYKTGLIRLRQGKKEDAKKILAEAVDILRKAEDWETLPDVLLTQGQVAISEKQWDEAEETLRDAYEGYTVNDDPQGLVDTSIHYGKVLWELGRQADGEKTLMDALKTSRRIEYNRQSLRSQASVHCMLGTLFEEINEHDKAAAHFNSALDLTKNIYDRESEALIYANLRVLLEATGGLKKAVEYEQKALVIHTELRDLEAMAVDHTNLAYLAGKMGKPVLVKEHTAKARELYLQFGNQEKADEIDRTSL